MTAPADEKSWRLASRISSLSSADRILLERFLDTLEKRASAPEEKPMDRIRRRIEAARAQQT